MRELDEGVHGYQTAHASKADRLKYLDEQRKPLPSKSPAVRMAAE